MQLSVKSDINKMAAQIGRFYSRQIQFATSVAMNKTGDDIKRVEQAAMNRELDNPTRPTVRGVRFKRSSKYNLNAVVFIIPHIDKFIKYQIHGGTRPPRGRAEAVPVNLKLNRYGNIPGRRRGKLAKLISDTNKFSGKVNGVGGIWQRTGNGLRLLVAYEPKTNYAPRFKFYQHATRTTNARWPRHFNRSIKHAIRTAR